VAGQDLILELHAATQRRAFDSLAAAGRSGSVVVMDPRDNALRAIASTPGFDPNRFVIGLSDAEWQELNSEARPLMLRATESAYPTGSIFKIVTMAAGMEHGGFTPSRTFDCGLNWNGLPGQTLHNWEAQGTLSLTQALTQSCNPAFYEIGLALDGLDPTLLPAMATTFGLGRVTHAAGLHEVAGTLPTPAWKQQQLRQPWTSGDSVNLAIGQGYLLATPLQMANAYAALARGDAVMPPRLLADAPAQPGGQLNLSQSTRAAILEGMKRVTSPPRGTAAYAFQGERLPIAAKTGSAENENPDAHAWFVGFTPPEGASLLVLVMVEGGQQGGAVAAPIARQIIDFAFPLAR
jgi:penicillin-binding protein 2